MSDFPFLPDLDYFASPRFIKIENLDHNEAGVSRQLEDSGNLFDGSFGLFSRDLIIGSSDQLKMEVNKKKETKDEAND